jgi:hypothetical protein
MVMVVSTPGLLLRWGVGWERCGGVVGGLGTLLGPEGAGRCFICRSFRQRLGLLAVFGWWGVVVCGIGLRLIPFLLVGLCVWRGGGWWVVWGWSARSLRTV